MEQSYRQVKYRLGWSGYQVRKDLAIRRHWQLVICAFSFCWYGHGRSPTGETGRQTAQETRQAAVPESAVRGENGPQPTAQTERFLAGGVEGSERVAGTVDATEAILEAFSGMPLPPELKVLLEWVFSGKGLYLYAH